MTIHTLNGDGVNGSNARRDGDRPRRSERRLLSGIWSIAFTEMSERFSYYGLQGILTFYLLYSLADGGLDMGPAASAGIVGAYGGAVYLAQLLGAWMGERVLSPKHVVFWGGVVITAGHIVLAFAPGLTGLAIGLVLIVFGTGALKTNITNIVGFIVVGAEEARRDVGFAYFYMSINIGAVVGPLSTGFAQNQWGFHWGFGLAALGMVAALVQYAISMGKLPDRAGQVLRPIRRGRLALFGIIAAAIGTGIGWLIVSGTIRAAQLSVIVTVVTVLAAAGYFALMLTSPAVTSDEKARVRAYLPLFLIAGVFFGLLFQQFTAVAILISESVDLRIGTWTFPVAWVTMISQLAAVGRHSAAGQRVGPTRGLGTIRTDEIRCRPRADWRRLSAPAAHDRRHDRRRCLRGIRRTGQPVAGHPHRELILRIAAGGTEFPHLVPGILAIRADGPALCHDRHQSLSSPRRRNRHRGGRIAVDVPHGPRTSTRVGPALGVSRTSATATSIQPSAAAGRPDALQSWLR
ncbi:peptide MFS transporter [Brevibacterium casei]|uniref:peptide MFS transporter n=1 Tax=Brevibacterium casei TaxID=33889 RepID=UPI0021AF5790|nr:oligopeptide:H+ symporter [Brevibacterium casei]MCT1552129.1 oligopeptide:H+ symporter [Brevibacterium casei]MCT1561991.1 oligopeptide:H+ symporter [Brevibacterium casei]MCT2209845.1 oligopeptide:H+ symporter [Brevibacterium casei]